MRRPRLTIAALMVCVAGIAAVTAAFVAAYRDPSELTAGVASAVILATLCLAALLSVVRPGRQRGVWAGMAIFGLVYVAFAWFADGAPAPPTTALIDRTWDSVMPGTVVYRSMQEMGRASSLPSGFVDRPTARRIGHAIWALVIGVGGGVLGFVLGAPRSNVAE